jgi:hypothetical protein
MSGSSVIPAKAGIQAASALLLAPLDSRFRGNDGTGARE